MVRRWEGRESINKRQHSKLYGETRPKRPRRECKLTKGRTSRSHNWDALDHTDWNQNHHRRLQYSLPHETPLAPESVIGDVAGKELHKRIKRPHAGSKFSNDRTKHKEHDTAGQGDQIFSQRAISERGWWKNPKDQLGEERGEKMCQYEMQLKDKGTQAWTDENNVLRRDGFFKLAADAASLPVRRKPAFRVKTQMDSRLDGLREMETVRPKHVDQRASKTESRRRRRDNTCLPHETGFKLEERFNGGNNFRGKHSFFGRHRKRNHHGSSLQGEK